MILKEHIADDVERRLELNAHAKEFLDEDAT